MNDPSLHQTPSKLVPVLIGALAMTATAVIPVLNIVNCLCCAGIMGGAVLGVWFYKKNFPPDLPFTVGAGAVIGALSGLLGGILTAVVQALELGAFSGSFSSQWEVQIREIMEQMEIQGQDPATTEQIRQFLETLMSSPGLFILLMFGASVVVFVVFGLLGGIIGGNFFKTRALVQNSITPPPSGGDPVS